MDLLIDTHTLLWFLNDDKNLSKKAKNEIEYAQSQVWVSIVSLWEIAIKINIGKLKLDQNLKQIVESTLEQQIQILELAPKDLEEYVKLPLNHRDPFDRMIIATAKRLNIAIVSIDPQFDLYQVQRIW